MTQLHSALFIDYDNVRPELDRYDPGIEERERLGRFVTEIAQNARKPIPILRPAEYSFVFEALAEYFQGEEPGTFLEAIDQVAGSGRERGLEISVPEVRFIAAGISMQEYRFTEAAEAAHLAALWRAQVFQLCHEPDWLHEPEEAALLVAWIHAEREDLEEAREDFLRRTGGEAPEVASGTA